MVSKEWRALTETPCHCSWVLAMLATIIANQVFTRWGASLGLDLSTISYLVGAALTLRGRKRNIVVALGLAVVAYQKVKNRPRKLEAASNVMGSVRVREQQPLGEMTRYVLRVAPCASAYYGFHGPLFEAVTFQDKQFGGGQVCVTPFTEEKVSMDVSGKQLKTCWPALLVTSTARPSSEWVRDVMNYMSVLDAGVSKSRLTVYNSSSEDVFYTRKEGETDAERADYFLKGYYCPAKNRVLHLLKREKQFGAGLNIVLYGPEGTGKTSLVKRMAGAMGKHIVDVRKEAMNDRDVMISTLRRGLASPITQKVVPFSDAFYMMDEADTWLQRVANEDAMRDVNQCSQALGIVQSYGDNEQHCSLLKTLQSELEGINTPSDRVLFFCTNDPAAFKRGTLGRRFEFVYVGGMEQESMDEMCQDVYGKAYTGPEASSVPPSVLVKAARYDHQSVESFAADVPRLVKEHAEIMAEREHLMTTEREKHKKIMLTRLKLADGSHKKV